jgi:hypothetical protein
VNLAKLSLTVQQVVGLVQIGLTTIEAIRTHVAEGRVSVPADLTADEVVARVKDAQAAVLALGDAAAADVAAQHAGDPAQG